MKHVVVHNFEDCRKVLRKATKDKYQVVLENNPESFNFTGFLYVQEMAKLAQDKFPGKVAKFIFNAGDNPSAAVCSIKAGFKDVRFSGSREIYMKIKSIANQYSVELTS